MTEPRDRISASFQAQSFMATVVSVVSFLLLAAHLTVRHRDRATP